MSTTPFDIQCEILSDVWLKYRHDHQFEDFIQYNDIGLPLAFVLSEDMAKPTAKGESFVAETFALFLKALGIDEDEGYESLDDLLMGH